MLETVVFSNNSTINNSVNFQNFLIKILRNYCQIIQHYFLQNVV